MVTLEDLAGLDLFLWHGSGPKAAALLGCNQSTISRRVQRCSEVFGLRLKRRQGEWTLTGQHDLLLMMEREIHQVARLLGQAPLRLEGFPTGALPLIKPAPPGWCVGPLDTLGTDAPLALLRDRVIDAWLTDAADDIPSSLDFPAIVWPLARQPVTLLAHGDHPLAGESHLSLGDLQRFPLPVIPAAGFPRTHAICADIGLGTVEVNKRRYDTDSWEGQTADQVSLAFTTPLNARAFPTLARLDSGPLFTNRLALVCRADVGDHPKLQELHCLLLARLQHLKSHHPELDRLQLQA
ncbi:MAG: LysR family transcriptional regulator [Cyanobacteriota bacterium]|nr:LysR family transcriptional regulator [Cyanobacteriota bacterium]